MSISFQCPSCGRDFHVKDELAGRKARCGCGNECLIPDIPVATPVAAAASIQLHCTQCGHPHQVPPNMAGQRAQCGCGAIMQIPSPGQMPAQADPFGAAPSAADDPLGLGAQDASLFDDLPNPNAQAMPAPAQYDVQPHTADSLAASQGMLANAERQIYEDERRQAEVAREHEGGAFSLERRAVNGGVLGGILMMIGAAVWFFVGLAGGVIFFYPPVLFVLGIVSLVKGIADL